MATQEELDDVKNRIKLAEDERDDAKKQLDDVKKQTPTDRDMLLVLNQQLAGLNQQLAGLNQQLAELRREKNRLAEGSLVQDQLTTALKTALTTALQEGLTTLTQEVRQGFSQLPGRLEWLSQSVELSQVSQGQAAAVLEELGIRILEVSLQQMEALDGVPALTMELALFGMENYQDEKAATLPYKEHLHEKLAALMGPNVWKTWDLEDIRGQKVACYLSRKCYKGYLDLGIYPAGARAVLAQLRVGIELKHTDEHKKIWAQNHSHKTAQTVAVENQATVGSSAAVPEAEGMGAAAADTDAAEPVQQTSRKRARQAKDIAGVQWTSQVKGQTIMEMICTNRLCEWPLDLVVTDGQVYHLLRLRDDKLLVVQNVGAADGIRFIAANLSKINASPTFDYEASKSTLDPALLSARKRIKSLLAAECTNGAQHIEAVSATLRMWQQLAQLASCTDDRPSLIREFFDSHPVRRYELPPEIRRMYS